MDSLIPDSLKLPLAFGAMQLPGMYMQHKENMQAQEEMRSIRERGAQQQEKFLENLAAGVNAW